MSIIINPRMTNVQASRTKALQSGFTLIEILVAIVILSIGLLGVASLQVQGLKNNQSAYLRTQAAILAYDMADRMRTNPSEADTYADFDTLGVVPPDPQCISNDAGCSAQNLAFTDLFEWAERLNGTEESAILLPDAQGTIDLNDDGVFIITVSWNETSWDEDAQSKQVIAQRFFYKPSVVRMKTMNQHLTTLKKMAGLSLIELMIAMTISSLLLLGVTNIYFNSRETDKFTSELSRIQETGRQALDFLARDIRMSGYLGCLDSGTPGEIRISASNPPTEDFRNSALLGFEVTDSSWVEANVVDGSGEIIQNLGEHFLGATFINDALIGSDVIALQRTSTANTALASNMAASNSDIELIDNIQGFQQGDIAVISNCQNADIFRISNDPNAGGTFLLEHDLTTNSGLALVAPYTTNARVMRLESVLYFVGDTGRTTAKGSPINALYRVTDNMSNSAAPTFTVEEIIEGVDNMQILYGERIGASGLRYVTADRLTSMEGVESIQLGLLLSGTQDVLVQADDNIYNLPGEAIEPEDSATANVTYDADRRLRREFVTTINLRNR